MEDRDRHRPLDRGPELFCRYAQPPNLLGYCGPDETTGVSEIASGLTTPAEEVARIAGAFSGAWPYLELIGNLSGRGPLSEKVVEAYWIGNELSDSVSLLDWGNSVSERFRSQAGRRWPAVEQALNLGGSPNHAFHVFCVYPWVGLLREGFVGPSLQVLDRCRISWGTVVESGSTTLVSRHPLVWVEDTLRPGEPVVETFRVPSGLSLSPGDHVSTHWDFVCARLTGHTQSRLVEMHDRHLRIANHELRASRLEPAR